MSQPNRCPECGAELPSGALSGLCPKCLLAAGLESHADPAGPTASDPAAPTTPHSGSFVPPDIAWLSAYFPQLEILELLGHGGMGAVYKARQPKLDRLVALKIIRPETADDPAFAERFNREARMLARLSHPHIVAVYDFGEVNLSTSEEGAAPRRLYFFLMEYVDGTNLRQLLQSGELLPEQALAIVPQICEALQFAHDEGVVHRDIKPENILLDKRGRVKIADFGLAKLAAGSPQEFTLTGTHQVMGTPRYMAPEQMEGSHAVDHRADIYSLGVVFYEMLTGEVPMGHFEPPSNKVQVDVRLDEVVLRTLAREPQRRYQHASDVKSDVESISARPRLANRRQSNEVAADDADLSAVRQQVQLPVVGLLVLAILSLSLASRAFLARYGSSTLSESPEQILFGLAYFLPPLATLVGAVKMLQLSSYRWAIAACLLVILSPGVLEQRQAWWIWWVCVAIGVWSLVVLSKPEVKRAFASRSRRPGPEPRETRFSAQSPHDEVLARAEVRAPAIALTAVGVFEWVACWAAAGIAGLAFREQIVTVMGSEDAMGSLLLTVILLGAILSALVIVAGLKMRRLESRAFCIFGSFIAMLISPGNVIGLPVGIWSIYVLTRPEVKAAFVLRRQRLTGVKSAGNGSVVHPERTALAPGMGPRLLLIGGAMVFGALVIASGLVSLVIGFVKESPSSNAFWGWMGSAVGCILGGAGTLLGTWNNYRQLGGRADLFAEPNRIWLDDAIHGLTLIGILTVAAAMVLSNWFPWYPACYFLVLMGGIVTFQGTLFMIIRAVMRRAAQQESATVRGYGKPTLPEIEITNVESQLSVTPHSEVTRLVAKPAWGLIITGVISWITIPLGFAIPFMATEKLNAAQRTIFQISFGVIPLVVGTIMALAGFQMKRLESYRLAMFAAVLPIAVLLFKLVGLSFGTLAIGPADLLGAPIGLWALVVLSRSDVRAAFHRLSPEHGAAPQTSRGTLGRAWDEWWAERDRWFTRSVLLALVLVHIACLAMFLTLRGGGGFDSGRASAWHHVGWPSPWFMYERGVEPKVAFRRTINLLSSSALIAAIGMLAWYAFWRIQLVRDARNARFWRTIGSPTAVLIVWIVAGAAFAWLGVANAKRLYEGIHSQMVPIDSQRGAEAPGFDQRAELSDDVAIPPSEQDWTMTLDGPMLTDGFARMLELDSAQTEELNRILQGTYSEYLKIEQQYLEEQKVDDRQVIVTIKPHPEAAAKLEDHLWTQLDAVLDPKQQRIARLNLQLEPPEAAAGRALVEIVGPGFFGWGKDGAEIEIRQVGTWYHWKVKTRGYEYDTDMHDGEAPRLPEWLHRFWKEPYGQATSPRSDR